VADHQSDGASVWPYSDDSETRWAWSCDCAGCYTDAFGDGATLRDAVAALLAHLEEIDRG